MIRRAALLLAGVAVLALQGCDREPPRTVVTPPRHLIPEDMPRDAAAARPAPPTTAGEKTIASGATPEPAPPARHELPAVRNAGDSIGAALLAQRSLQVPVVGIAPARLSDTYEQSRGKRTHEAIDILAPAGTPVVAVDDGRIVKLFTSKPGGLTIYQYDREGRLAYYYAHLRGYAPSVREGMEVKRGEVIGYVGSTGNADPGTPHLHFAVFRLGTPPKWWQGDPVNPYPALSRAEPAQQVATR
jgi:murein DD-endopeptidase MepM/ murein hydrolase activator NlpD